MIAPSTVDQVDTAQRDALIECLLAASVATFNVYAIYIGERLGLYRALAEGGPQTSLELAARTGTIERYVREWLEHQAVEEVVGVEDPSVQDGQQRRYFLPASFYEVLVDEDSPTYLGALPRITVGAAQPVHRVLEAFQRGGGVAFEDYGADVREGQAAMNRVLYLTELGQQWLPSIPDVDARLRAGRPARIADLGCGVGWSSIGMARAYPNAAVDGFDLDSASIEQAKQNLARTEVADRVRFHRADAADVAPTKPYDLVVVLEALHDMANPVGVLATMRRLAGNDGAVIVVDERVADGFLQEGNDLEGLLYGFSILHCLPAAMVETPSAATGTVMRANTLRQYALEAGFRRVEVLPIENVFFRVYRLHQ